MRRCGTGAPASWFRGHRIGVRPITPVTTVLLALVAAAITVWLGLVAQFGGVVGESGPVPDRLAVVQVQMGETLQQVAGRVAPDAPVSQVVDRIRELNQLDSVAVDAGQTLIAPDRLTVAVSGERLGRTTAFGATPAAHVPINTILGWRGAAQVRSRAFELVVCWRGEGAVMHCPFCRHPDSRVVDSRETDEGQAIRRRRSCPECGRRFTTVETAVLAVVKRSGVTEPFSREKVIKGVRRACQGRQVDDDALNLLAQQVEDAVRATGSPEVPSNEVGLAILGPLRELDEVAYLRFASVYRGFTSAEDFEREIQALREHRKSPQPTPG